MAVFTDDFTGTDGSAVDLRTGWSLGKGTSGYLQILSNQAVGLGPGVKYDVVDTAVVHDTTLQDHYVQADWNGADYYSNLSLVLKFVDSNNYIHLYERANKKVLSKTVGGARSDVATAIGPYRGGGTWKVEVSGTTYNVYQNGSLVGGPYTITDSVFTSATKAGIGVIRDDRPDTMDNFECPTSSGGGGGGPTSNMFFVNFIGN